ncbi:MAG: DUF429 domain-containing protein [Anaerolineales bacterium]|uniref:DUF429 domain-containing protein n=1 Tax=Candidatus Desulfolinea nitratireducens TaxID=2841698 RepID=A0A8J6NIV5_9CHLR|nr:DUF429 domain-containing protein [Candidatus Desulfolinea nitratireducens]MBL6961970.1 DUF429 domain-containing protein [Anaerolineales bacterium]
MFFNQTSYIGIDLTGRKAFTYAALNADLKLLALAAGELEDILSFVGGQAGAYVAINAPARPNQGRVRALLESESLTSEKSPLRGADIRMAEYELHQRGIKVAGTPSRAELCPSWMRSGFALYEKLTGLGFLSFPGEDAKYQVLETHPQAAFIAMADGNLLPISALEGRLQRQTILYGEGLQIHDPMEFFEEITRHRLRQGVLPVEQIYISTQLNALLAAYTAWLVSENPEDTTSLGDEAEGKIYFPVTELKSRY